LLEEEWKFTAGDATDLRTPPTSTHQWSTFNYYVNTLLRGYQEILKQIDIRYSRVSFVIIQVKLPASIRSHFFHPQNHQSKSAPASVEEKVHQKKKRWERFKQFSPWKLQHFGFFFVPTGSMATCWVQGFWGKKEKKRREEGGKEVMYKI